METSVYNDKDTQYAANFMAEIFFGKSNCSECRSQLIQSNSNDLFRYIALLSHSGLLHSSESLSYVTSAIFAQIIII